MSHRRGLLGFCRRVSYRVSPAVSACSLYRFGALHVIVYVVDARDALLSLQRMLHGRRWVRRRGWTLKKILLIGSISKYTTTPVFRFVLRARFRQISLHCVCQEVFVHTFIIQVFHASLSTWFFYLGDDEWSDAMVRIICARGRKPQQQQWAAWEGSRTKIFLIIASKWMMNGRYMQNNSKEKWNELFASESPASCSWWGGWGGWEKVDERGERWIVDRRWRVS